MNSAELFRTANTLDDYICLDAPEIEALIEAATKIDDSFSGSWFGYHSRVYYENFDTPPPGAEFSLEWGLRDTYSSGSTRGTWRECAFDDVVSVIEKAAGNPNTDQYSADSKHAAEIFEEAKSATLSIIHAAPKRDSDNFLNNIIEKIESYKVLTRGDFIEYQRPKGQSMSRDVIAIQKGLITPPHLHVMANADSIKYPFQACKELRKLILQLANHMKNIESQDTREERIGTNIFIGHGRSPLWRELKDFVNDRLALPWEEFNRVPVAGVTNITRLVQMLDQASFAFLVMTAEDEQADGNKHARMNVIHEVGLFQGRLGFERAIVLLEEGCEEFSNIQGLGQIRFPKGNISAIFEEIRAVLEREKITL